MKKVVKWLMAGTFIQLRLGRWPMVSTHLNCQWLLWSVKRVQFSLCSVTPHWFYLDPLFKSFCNGMGDVNIQVSVICKSSTVYRNSSRGQVWQESGQFWDSSFWPQPSKQRLKGWSFLNETDIHSSQKNLNFCPWTNCHIGARYPLEVEVARRRVTAQLLWGNQVFTFDAFHMSVLT